MKSEPITYLSVCSGIEAASVAWEPLGWKACGFAEIEKFPAAVLAHHWPNVPNLGDMTKHHEWPNTLRPNLIVGGTPCQAFSVAGLRQGLADPRGNLTLVFLGLLEQYRPRWVVWENVPGVLSDKTGAFGAFLGGLAELGYGFAYRVLDAQHFGVPQRRRRVFVVGYLGDWRRAAAVLFEPESLRGDHPPSRKARKGIAGNLTSRAGNSSRPAGAHGNLIASTGEVSHCLNAGGMGRQDYETETLITHSLRGEGYDASEDGTGRGTPLVPVHMTGAGYWKEGFGTLRAREQDSHENLVAFAIQAGALKENPNHGPDGIGVRGDDVAYTLEARAEVQAVCFSCKDHGADAGDISPTLLRAGASHSGDKGDGGMNTTTVATRHAVRRLTPEECEKLQGFPVGHTLIPWRGKMAPDGPRYKALGNSMAVPVMRWIGEKISELHKSNE